MVLQLKKEDLHNVYVLLKEYSVKYGTIPLKILLLHVFCFQIDLNSREQETCQPVHVINVDIQDNHEEATLGAFLICELCQCVSREGSLPVGSLDPADCTEVGVCLVIFEDAAYCKS